MEDKAQRPSLESLVGEMIWAIIPVLNKEETPDAIQQYRLHALEPSGLWLENQELTEIILEAAEITFSEVTRVLFVPFPHVKIVLGIVAVPSLSEKMLQSKEQSHDSEGVDE